jgi:hypothetical protein
VVDNVRQPSVVALGGVIKRFEPESDHDNDEFYLDYRQYSQ